LCLSLDWLVWFAWSGLVNLIGFVEYSLVELSLFWYGLVV
jgi:hypothetical protein